MYRGRYSSKYGRSSSSSRTSYVGRKYVKGKGAYYVPRRQYSKSISYKPRYVKGRGAYFVSGGLHATGKLGPFKAGAAVNAGYTSGDFTSRGFPTVSGLGAYDVSRIRSNVLLQGDPPVVRNAASYEGAVVIRHREYIQDIVSSTSANTFKVDAFPLNPGMAVTFPWLSSIAGNFEEFVINGMLFEFKSITSDAIASSTLATMGEVILATQYDALNAPFTNNAQMLNYEFAQCSKASDNVLHMIECDPHQTAVSTHLYVRQGVPPGNSDLRLYDHGTFYIASNQINGTSVVLGQLWCTYEFMFFKPKLNVVSSGLGSMFKAYNPSLSGTSYPLGSGVFTFDVNNNVACTVVSNMISFPITASAVTYLVTVNWNGMASGAQSVPTPTAGSCYRIKAFQNNSAVIDYSPNTGATSTSATLNMCITTIANGLAPTLQFPYSFPTSNQGSVDIIITEIAYLAPSVYGYA